VAGLLELGLQHHSAGRLDQAEAAYREILAAEPDNIDALHFLGVVAYQRGAHAQAEELISGALRRHPANAPAHNNLGNALGAQGKLEEAIGCYERAIALQPDYGDALVNLAAACTAAGELDKAIDCYRRALAVSADLPAAYTSLGNALAQKGKLAEAGDCLRKAIELGPRHAQAHSGLGNVLRHQDRLEEAVEALRKAVTLAPNLAEAYGNLALTLIAQGKSREAEENCVRALKLRPDSAQIKFALSQIRLLLGDYDSGFALYEHRLDKDALPKATYAALQARVAQVKGSPRWRGEPGAGRALLVWTDQGLGDTLMMMRYFPLLKGRGFGRVLVHCEEALLRIVRAIPGVDEVVSRAAPSPVGRFDCQIPLTSLPLAFGTRVETIPGKVPYLAVPAELKRKWAARLADVAPPRVGLVWAGRKDYPKDALRSLPLRELAPLFAVPGVRFVNLQKGDEARQVAQTGLPLVDRIDECADLMETAAMIGELDLVICVDTAVMHLAGALGKPLWMLNRFETEWRWMLERADSPWYPSLRIFRQQRPNDWSGVVAQVTDALRESFSGQRS
jgi:tetratricopeptide (TPR) repeat protein